MSAWLCSDVHVKVLGLAATGWEGTDTSIDGPRPEILKQATKNANTLRRANNESLGARYGDRHHPMPSAVSARDARRYAAVLAKPAWIAKMVGCFDYQACEYDGWYRSKAHGLLGKIALSYLGHVDRKGDTEIPWGLEVTHVDALQPKVISLYNLAKNLTPEELELCRVKK